ncbi:MAG: extracellular solute-binding protein [Phototrophicaceae bacterium]|jgi:sn-glycerol 3-phosphate transport system substrate-binding protein
MQRKALLLVVLFVLGAMTLLPVAAQDATEIRVWIAFADYRLDWAREKAAAFNEQFPQYNVVIEGYDNYEVIFSSAALAFEEGTPPAIVQYFEAATQDARDAKSADGTPWFKPVQEALGEDGEVNGLVANFDDIVPAVRDYYTFDGVFNSMPWNTSSAIMFSNQNMLDAAGITEIPDTWQEIEAACAIIMALENAPANCITWPNHGWFFEQSVAQQGADLVNNANGRDARATETFIASDAAVSYVSWWKGMQDAGYYIYTGSQRDWTGTYNAFTAQQVAFLVYSSSDTTAITNDAVANDFVATASFMPHNGEVDYAGNLIGGATLWLTNGLDATTEEGALTFLVWFTNTENAADWHKVTGYVPVRTSSVELLEAEGWYAENPNSLVASAQLAAAQPMSATAGAIVGSFPSIRNEVTAAIEDILVNGTDVATALDGAQTRSNALLEEYNLLAE